MKSPNLMSKITKSAVHAAKVPVTVKMRIGWDKENINVVEAAKRVEDRG